MANPPRPPTNKDFGVKGECYCCGARIKREDSAWYVRTYEKGKENAVFCFSPECCKAASRYEGVVAEQVQRRS